ncbi:glycosyltransferase [Vibrio metschnikovii]|nr:glycosyltransferase [Vibrio metschnikovii]
MPINFYLYSRSPIYSGAEKMLLVLAKALGSISSENNVHLTYSTSDIANNEYDFIFKRLYKPSLVRVSTRPYKLLLYFLMGFLCFFDRLIFKRNAVFIFNDLESLIINWPIALFKKSYFYLHDSHKLSNFKARIICKLISLLVNKILVITKERVRLLANIGVLNTIYFPNCLVNNNKIVVKETKPDEIHCICIAQITRWKRIDKSIELFKLLSKENSNINWYLHICGRPNESDLEGVEIERNIIQQSNLDKRIIYHGYQEDLTPFWRKCQILISMSENEPFGLALVEALQQGCYLLSAEGEGPKEIIGSDNVGKIIINLESLPDWVSKNNEVIINFTSFGWLGQDRLANAHNFSYENYFERVILVFKNEL